MGYYEKRKKRMWIYLIIIIGAIYYYIAGPVYESPKVEKSSKWYVNDMYMSTQYYYDNLLNKEEKEAYEKIFYGIKNMEQRVILSIEHEGALKAWRALVCDHPEMINLKWFKWTYEEGSTTIFPTYLTTSEFLLKLKVRKMQRMIGKVVKDVEGMTEYEKEKYVYEWVGKKSAYSQSSDSSDQSAYTAFSSLSNTVCAGYGKAAQILLNNVGVNSIININSDHIWNTVKLDGEYYFFDTTVTSITRETFEGNVSYMGLNQNKDTSNYEILYPSILPNISGKKYNYYDYEGLTMTYSDAKIDMIKKIIDNSEHKKVEIKFTNPEEAYSRIIEKYLDYLEVKSIIDWNVENKGNYCANSGVLMFEKK